MDDQTGQPMQGVAIATLDGSATCLLYTSDAADERSSVDLGGRRIIKKKKNTITSGQANMLLRTTHQYHEIA